jgi:hypothetical protein
VDSPYTHRVGRDCALLLFGQPRLGLQGPDICPCPKPFQYILGTHFEISSGQPFPTLRCSKARSSNLHPGFVSLTMKSGDPTRIGSNAQSTVLHPDATGPATADGTVVPGNLEALVRVFIHASVKQPDYALSLMAPKILYTGLSLSSALTVSFPPSCCISWEILNDFFLVIS